MKNYETIQTVKELETVYPLLEEAFPYNERREYASLKKAWENQRIKIYHKNYEMMMVIWPFDSFNYLEYFVVKKNKRNSGYGSCMLQDILSSSNKPLILEAELPETDIAKRRLGFYQRNGMIDTHHHYIQPAYHPGDEEVTLEFLSSRPVSQDTLQTIEETIVLQAYGFQ